MQFCLIGYPLIHSMSPFIHHNLFNISNNPSTYQNIEISPAELNVSSLASFDGFNVTIPHKIAIIPFLHEICGNAEIIKTVNTVKKQNGKLFGYNTDCDGFLETLKLSNIELRGKVLICGCGGTSRMMCYLAAKNGCDITISYTSKNIERAVALKNEVNSIYDANIKIITDEYINDDFDLLLNGTPAGMYKKNIDLLPVSESTVLRCKNVFDAVYNPIETKLIKLSKKNNINVAYGMPMLVFQAAKAHEIWYNAKFNNSDLLNLIDKTNYELERRFK